MEGPLGAEGHSLCPSKAIRVLPHTSDVQQRGALPRSGRAKGQAQTRSLHQLDGRGGPRPALTTVVLGPSGVRPCTLYFPRKEANLQVLPGSPVGPGTEATLAASTWRPPGS